MAKKVKTNPFIDLTQEGFELIISRIDEIKSFSDIEALIESQLINDIEISDKQMCILLTAGRLLSDISIESAKLKHRYTLLKSPLITIVYQLAKADGWSVSRILKLDNPVDNIHHLITYKERSDLLDIIDDIMGGLNRKEPDDYDNKRAECWDIMEYCIRRLYSEYNSELSMSSVKERKYREEAIKIVTKMFSNKLVLRSYSEVRYDTNAKEYARFHDLCREVGAHIEVLKCINNVNVPNDVAYRMLKRGKFIASGYTIDVLDREAVERFFPYLEPRQYTARIAKQSGIETLVELVDEYDTWSKDDAMFITKPLSPASYETELKWESFTSKKGRKRFVPREVMNPLRDVDEALCFIAQGSGFDDDDAGLETLDENVHVSEFIGNNSINIDKVIGIFDGEPTELANYVAEYENQDTTHASKKWRNYATAYNINTITEDVYEVFEKHLSYLNQNKDRFTEFNRKEFIKAAKEATSVMISADCCLPEKIDVDECFELFDVNEIIYYPLDLHVIKNNYDELDLETYCAHNYVDVDFVKFIIKEGIETDEMWSGINSMLDDIEIAEDFPDKIDEDGISNLHNSFKRSYNKSVITVEDWMLEHLNQFNYGSKTMQSIEVENEELKMYQDLHKLNM